MGRFSLATYRTQWPRVGAVAAVAVAGATTLAGERFSRPRRLAALNLTALLAHQYEEYRDPGYFPGQFNRGLLKSDTPRNYPLNTDTSMWINTAIAYPFYAAPVLFPEKKWLGLAPVFFGFGQAAVHSVVFPRFARLEGHAYTYSPGLLTSMMLHVPIGLAYIAALRDDGPIGKRDWLKSLGFFAAFAPLSIGAPSMILKDPDSPHAFTEAQMGPYNPDMRPTAGDAVD